MIAPDANLLIYASDPASSFHARAHLWLEDVLSSAEPVGLPIISLYAFLRFVTNPRIAPAALAFGAATTVIDRWLALPHVRILYPGDRHWQILQSLSKGTRLTGNLITDATIAAIAQEYGAVVHTNDRDFARFPGVRWHNPLA